MTYREAMRAAERAYLLGQMKAYRWNHKLAAEAAGLNRTHMYRMLDRNGIARKEPPVIRRTRKSVQRPRALKRLKLDRSRVLDLRTAGFAPNRIAAWLRVTPRWVRQILQSAA